MNAYGTYRNSADFGADGHVWALDAARESIQIWQIGTNTYCFKRQDIGTFTTFAGVSPEGTGTVSAGVTGRWNGELVTRDPRDIRTDARHEWLRRGLRPAVPAGRHMPRGCLQCEHYLSSFDSLQFLKFRGDVRSWSMRCAAPVKRTATPPATSFASTTESEVQSTRGSMPPPRGAGAPTQGGSCMKLDTVCRGRWHGHRVRGNSCIASSSWLPSSVCSPRSSCPRPLRASRRSSGSHLRIISCLSRADSRSRSTSPERLVDISYTDALGNFHELPSWPSVQADDDQPRHREDHRRQHLRPGQCLRLAQTAASPKWALGSGAGCG